MFVLLGYEFLQFHDLPFFYHIYFDIQIDLLPTKKSSPRNGSISLEFDFYE